MMGSPVSRTITTVRAVSLVRTQRDADLTRGALAEQTRRPEHAVLVSTRSAAVPTDGVGWIWLLDEGVLPHPGALEAFLEALERSHGLAAPALLAGQVVAPDGSLHAGSQPYPMVRDPDLVAEAFERRMAPVRLAPGGSLLVDARAFGAVAGSGGDPLLWSARLLVDRLGLLVPASVAVRRSARGGVQERGGAWFGLLAGDALEPRDRAYLALRFAESASAGLRERVGRPRRPA